MKKLLGAGLAVMLLFGAAACAGDTTQAPSGVAGNATTDPAGVIAPSGIAVSPDGRRIAAGCGGTCVWDVRSGRRTATWTGGGPVAWSPDGRTIAVTGDNLRILLLDATDGHQLRALTGYAAPGALESGQEVAAVTFTPDGSRLVAAAYDGTARIWDTRTGDLVRTLDLGRNSEGSIAVSPDNGYVTVATETGAAHAWAMDGGDPTEVTGSPGHGRAVAYSHDGRWLAIGSGDKQRSEQLWSDMDHRPTSALAGLDPTALSFNPASTQLGIANGEDDTIRIWPVSGGAVRTLKGHTDTPFDVKWSPDGALLFSSSSHDGIIVWNAATGKILRRLR